MEDLVGLLERPPDQQYVVWALENGLMFFGKGFSTLEAAEAFAAKLKKMNRDAHVQETTQGVSTNSFFSIEPQQASKSISTLVRNWELATRVDQRIQELNQAMNLIMNEINQQCLDHPEHKDAWVFSASDEAQEFYQRMLGYQSEDCPDGVCQINPTQPEPEPVAEAPVRTKVVLDETSPSPSTQKKGKEVVEFESESESESQRELNQVSEESTVLVAPPKGRRGRPRTKIAI